MFSYSSQNKLLYNVHLPAFIHRFNREAISGYKSQEASQIQGPMKAHVRVIKAVMGSARILI